MLGWNIQLLGSMGPSNLCFGFQVRDKVGLDLDCAFSPPKWLVVVFPILKFWLGEVDFHTLNSNFLGGCMVASWSLPREKAIYLFFHLSSNPQLPRWSRIFYTVWNNSNFFFNYIVSNVLAHKPKKFCQSIALWIV